MKDKQNKVDIQKCFDIEQTKGRPRYILNEYGKLMIKTLAGYMCTDEEISAVLGVNLDTLLNERNKETFSECKKRGIDEGKASLRRKQYEIAMKGNASMLIWLGKQWLGQTDKVENTTSFEDLSPLAELLKKKD